MDCTFGRGGHSLALLKSFPKSSIVALDRDRIAVEFAKKHISHSQVTVLHQNFYQFPLTNTETFDLILMDLGPSSPQLDQRERGFSFYKEGPLDMRMDQSQSLTAKHIINSWTKKELIELFQQYGEIKKPYLVVEQILKARKKQKIETTTQLAGIIKQYSRSSRWNKHPATQWFLALRIAVNQELEGLKQSLPLYLPLLNSQGFFVVISFHSLEDRIVKHSFKDFVKNQQAIFYNKKVIRPQKEERLKNPRSHSAKMRVIQKT